MGCNSHSWEWVHSSGLMGVAEGSGCAQNPLRKREEMESGKIVVKALADESLHVFAKNLDEAVGNVHEIRRNFFIRYLNNLYVQYKIVYLYMIESSSLGPEFIINAFVLYVLCTRLTYMGF